MRAGQNKSVCVCLNEGFGLLMFLWQLQTKACCGCYDNGGGECVYARVYACLCCRPAIAVRV